MDQVLNRRRSSKKIRKACIGPIRKAIRKAKKTSKGLSCGKILKLTNCWPRFIGCFSQNDLLSLSFNIKPVFLMVHIGHDRGHWIALGVFDDKIEVFDPLGFKIFDWPSIPCGLLNFLYTHSTNKKLVLAGKVQPDDSKLCGFYCLFYLYKRHFYSLSKIESLLSNLSTNDDKLADLF